MNAMESLEAPVATVSLSSEAQTQLLRRKGVAGFYRPELDFLRFLAFLSVFFCHALPFDDANHAYVSRAWQCLQAIREAGSFGVCLFFLLSSYLITELLRRELLASKSVHLKAFYLRRTLRIWPLYFTVLLSVSILGIYLPALHMPLAQFLAFTLFVSNWYGILSPTAIKPLGWFWSISVEEQFYLIWPTIAKLGGMRGITTASLICLPVSVFSIAFVENYQHHPEINVWLNGVVQFQFFAWGALLAVLISDKLPSWSRSARIALAGAGCISWVIASAVCQLKRSDVDPGFLRVAAGYELVAFGCICFFLATLGISVSRLPKVVIYLGKISYGLYIFHELALSAMTALRHHFEQVHAPHAGLTGTLFVVDRGLALLTTVVVATLSYRYLESPFLTLKSRFTYVRSRPV